jgi:hypothetical protein
MAIWPGPLPDEERQALAPLGIADFVPPGHEDPYAWDAALTALTERLVTWLMRQGRPLLREWTEGSPPFLHMLPSFRRRRSRIVNELRLGMSDSDLTCVVEWGHPAVAVVCTGDGWPVYWLGCSSEAQALFVHLLGALAEGRAIRETLCGARLIDGSSHPWL